MKDFAAVAPAVNGGWWTTMRSNIEMLLKTDENCKGHATKNPVWVQLAAADTTFSPDEWIARWTDIFAAETMLALQTHLKHLNADTDEAKTMLPGFVGSAAQKEPSTDSTDPKGSSTKQEEQLHDLSKYVKLEDNTEHWMTLKEIDGYIDQHGTGQGGGKPTVPTSSTLPTGRLSKSAHAELMNVKTMGASDM
eukprot:5116346-Karenia_brevis.AAC.1